MDESEKENVNEVRLLDERIQPYKLLKGYEKHHRVPQACTDNDFRFLAKLVEPEIDDDLQDTFGELRSRFGFKRKEIEVIGPSDGAGVINTPFFSYEIQVCQNEEDPSKVIWRRSVFAISDPEQIFNESFEKIFQNKFTILEASTSSELDLESIVDHVEDAELDSVRIDYDKDITWCEIQVVGSIVSVKIRPNSIRVTSKNEIAPHELLEAFLDIQRRFVSTLNCKGNPFLVDSV